MIISCNSTYIFSKLKDVSSPVKIFYQNSLLPLCFSARFPCENFSCAALSWISRGVVFDETPVGPKPVICELGST